MNVQSKNKLRFLSKPSHGAAPTSNLVHVTFPDSTASLSRYVEKLFQAAAEFLFVRGRQMQAQFYTGSQ